MTEKTLLRTFSSLLAVFLAGLLLLPVISGARADTVYGEDIIDYARSWCGRIPYIAGGGATHADVTQSGTDCSGFICGVYYHFGIDLWDNRGAIRDSSRVFNIGTTDYNQAQPGDIIYWERRTSDSYGHVALYAGGGMMVEETSDNGGNVQYSYVSRLTGSANWPIKGIYRAYGVSPRPAVSYRDFGASMNKRIFFVNSRVSSLYVAMETKAPNTGALYADPVTDSAYTVGFDWQLIQQPDGTYVIYTYYENDRVLEVRNAGTSAGSVLQTGTYTGGDHQKWYICDAKGYDFILVPKNAPQLALTVSSSDWSLPSGLCLAAANDDSVVMRQRVLFEDVHYGRLTGLSRSGTLSDVILEAGQRILIPVYATSISDWSKLTARERNSMMKGIPRSRNTSVVQGYTDGAICGIQPGTAIVDFTSAYDERLSFTLTITVKEKTAEKRNYLPSSLKTICEEAFSDADINDTLIIPDGCRSIGKYAFFSCSSLRHIYIPASVTEIDPTAFMLHRSDLAIYAPSGSAAISFAREKGIIYSILPAE